MVTRNIMMSGTYQTRGGPISFLFNCDHDPHSIFHLKLAEIDNIRALVFFFSTK